jgi:hypothetical protein
VHALGRQLPLTPEIALRARLGARGNDGQEQRAIPDLPANILIPGIPAPKLVLIEPDFQTVALEGLGNAPRRGGVLPRVAEEDGALGAAALRSGKRGGDARSQGGRSEE